MTHRLSDDEWRAAAASRPGYATYPDYRPGKPERLGELPSLLPPPPACSHGYVTHVSRGGATVHPDGVQCRNPRPWRSTITEPTAEHPAPVALPQVQPSGGALDARPPTVDTEPPPATLAALPPTRVFDFQPHRLAHRRWWQPRWHWCVIAADNGVHHGYAWTEAGARRRTARRAAR
ncbi:hypothetical protein O7622_01105 [Micromonospora sp. WMMD1076]|uniref:hypothetical protein n=1 Tax=Micromonospora sp. WMMD1076 TaxID=3016103 RepID=UPI00249C5681|nr:hypothetical protein [Micromonospora sp. WMMD1076]WFF07228.1 hypothetical protein O7622_01105 [Micromonospora sp. WMMD1076]